MRSVHLRRLGSGALASALLLAAEGVAFATRQCPPGTHPSQLGFMLAAILGGSVTLVVFAGGLKVALGYGGLRRFFGVVLTVLVTLACGYFAFFFTMIVGLLLSGCIED